MSDGTESLSAGQRRQRRTRVAVVDGDNRDKTIKVSIERLMKHPKYGKYQRRRGILHVHDEKNEAKVGDVVEIVECRPISKTKSWRLCKIIRRGEGHAAEAAEPAAGRRTKAK